MNWFLLGLAALAIWLLVGAWTYVWNLRWDRTQDLRNGATPETIGTTYEGPPGGLCLLLPFFILPITYIFYTVTGVTAPGRAIKMVIKAVETAPRSGIFYWLTTPKAVRKLQR